MAGLSEEKKLKILKDILGYFHRESEKQILFKCPKCDHHKRKLSVNNVLVLEIDDSGILAKKDFYNIDDMKKIKFSKDQTTVTYTKRSFVYDFLASMRQKINDPLGKRTRK